MTDALEGHEGRISALEEGGGGGPSQGIMTATITGYAVTYYSMIDSCKFGEYPGSIIRLNGILIANFKAPGRGAYVGNDYTNNFNVYGEENTVYVKSGQSACWATLSVSDGIISYTTGHNNYGVGNNWGADFTVSLLLMVQYQ